jgi:hypothetical protein
MEFRRPVVLVNGLLWELEHGLLTVSSFFLPFFPICNFTLINICLYSIPSNVFFGYNSYTCTIICLVCNVSSPVYCCGMLKLVCVPTGES